MGNGDGQLSAVGKNGFSTSPRSRCWCQFYALVILPCWGSDGTSDGCAIRRQHHENRMAQNCDLSRDGARGERLLRGIGLS